MPRPIATNFQVPTIYLPKARPCPLGKGALGTISWELVLGNPSVRTVIRGIVSIPFPSAVVSIGIGISESEVWSSQGLLPFILCNSALLSPHLHLRRGTRSTAEPNSMWSCPVPWFARLGFARFATEYRFQRHGTNNVRQDSRTVVVQ